MVLAPGQKAVARLIWRSTVTDANVPATSGSFLKIAPADGVAAQTVAPRGGIDLGTTGRLGVSPWTLPRPN